jgi:hypothetical protein
LLTDHVENGHVITTRLSTDTPAHQEEGRQVRCADTVRSKNQKRDFWMESQASDWRMFYAGAENSSGVNISAAMTPTTVN